MKSTAVTLLATVKLARLKASFSGDWRRWTSSASAVPATIASTTTSGGAKKNPTTSGSSLNEKEWASRRNWMWTTNTSAAQNSGMSSHQGIWRGAGMTWSFETTSTSRKMAVRHEDHGQKVDSVSPPTCSGVTRAALRRLGLDLGHARILRDADQRGHPLCQPCFQR